MEYLPSSLTWELRSGLVNGRRYPASARTQVDNSTYVIFGGVIDDSSSEIYQFGNSTEYLSLPPGGINDVPCAARISDGQVFFADDVGYILDVEEGVFRETDSPMLFRSYEAQCGVATKADGRKIIVVTGKYKNLVRHDMLSTPQ